MSNEAIVNHHFQTPIWLFEKPEWVNKVNKACDKYIKEAYKRDKKGKKDFGGELEAFANGLIIFEKNFILIHQSL